MELLFEILFWLLRLLVFLFLGLILTPYFWWPRNVVGQTYLGTVRERYRDFARVVWDYGM